MLYDSTVLQCEFNKHWNVCVFLPYSKITVTVYDILIILITMNSCEQIYIIIILLVHLQLQVINKVFSSKSKCMIVTKVGQYLSIILLMKFVTLLLRLKGSDVNK